MKKVFWTQIRQNWYNLPLLVSKVKAWEAGKLYQAVKTVQERECDRIQTEKEREMASDIREKLTSTSNANVFGKKTQSEIEAEVSKRIREERLAYEHEKRKAIAESRNRRRTLGS